MGFKGWPSGAIAFYEGLELDNSKTYWLAHKAEYEELVRGPMEDLAGELADEFGEARIYRPYRDTRFSADKSPYKTGIGAVLPHGYIHLSARGLMVGSGYYMIAADQLDRFRRAVDADASGTELVGLIEAAKKKSLQIGAHEVLKSAPRGYTKDHDRIDLLRHKGLLVWREWDVAAWLSTAKAKQRVIEVPSGAGPINVWLDANVGPSTLPERPRFG